jgi:Spy/CpxP family protein refolding chaperone
MTTKEDAPMPEARTKIIGLLVLIFLLGTAVGALGYRVLLNKGYVAGVRSGTAPRHRDEAITRFTHELDLNPNQAQQLNSILEQSEEKFRDLNRSVKPQADAIRLESRNKIRAILTNEQKPKFEEMLRKMDEERQQREQRHNK